MAQQQFDPSSLLLPKEEEEQDQEIFDPSSLLLQKEEEPEEVFDPSSLLLPKKPEADQPTIAETMPVPEVDESPAYKLDVPKTFDEFTEDQGYIDSIKEYAISRYGDDGEELLKDKSNKEVLELFLSEVRGFETNSINLTGTIDYVRGATEEEKQNFGFIYSQLERMPVCTDFYLKVAAQPCVVLETTWGILCPIQ